MSQRKDVAVSFLQAAASGRVREAYGKHVDKAFKHHNPHFHGTADALMTGMEENARQNPQKRLDVLHAVEEGDLVAVHSRVQHGPADRGAALGISSASRAIASSSCGTSVRKCRWKRSTPMECSDGAQILHLRDKT